MNPYLIRCLTALLAMIVASNLHADTASNRFVNDGREVTRPNPPAAVPWHQETMEEQDKREEAALPPPSVPPQWGTASNGFAVSLRLDKNKYKVGEPIHAAIACTRYWQDWTRLGLDVTDLCTPILELRDMAGTPITLQQEMDTGAGDGSFHQCRTHGGSGHGFDGEIHVDKDVIIPNDRDIEDKTCLSDDGFFSSEPGKFVLVAKWYTGSGTVFSNPVPFEILPWWKRIF